MLSHHLGGLQIPAQRLQPLLDLLLCGCLRADSCGLQLLLQGLHFAGMAVLTFPQLHLSGSKLGSQRICLGLCCPAVVSRIRHLHKRGGDLAQ